VKIGLLKCDHVDTELLTKFGDHSDFFRNLFQKYTPEVSLDIFEVQKGEYPENTSDFHGFICTGSRFSVYDDVPWIHRLKGFIKELYDNHIKLVGICFGHQMIAEALGGKCSLSDNGWGLGVTKAVIYKKKHWMSTGMSQELDSFRLLLSHRDQIEALPPGGSVLAGNDHCPYSMITVGDHFLGIQGHPEFTHPFLKDLMQSRLDIMGEEAVSKASKTLNQKTDEAIIARWIVNFINSMEA
jgi:GMP synthase-like glutamine amidotransferase